MKITFVEGTVDEIQQVFPNLGAMLQSSAMNVISRTESNLVAAPANENPTLAQSAVSTKEKPLLTIDAVKELLTRQPSLSKLQSGVIEAVYAAGEAGTTSTQLALQLKTNEASVKAAMRLLGRRAANTDGWPEGVGVFRRKLNGTQTEYRLRAKMRELLSSNPEILKKAS